jgi:hypothetical protein
MHFKLRVSLGFALLLICLPKALAQTGSVAGTAFNHPILNQPVALTSSPAFGSFASAWRDNRQIQFGFEAQLLAREPLRGDSK